MQTLLFLALIFCSTFSFGQSVRETPQQALNQYVAFINQSVAEVANRFQRIQPYYADMGAYQSHIDIPPRLSPSGTLEEYYYKKALSGTALTDAEKLRLQTSAQAFWKLLTKIDQTAKALETYDRLKDYKRDNFKKANALIADLKELIDQFSQDKDAFYKQIQRIYRRYQPYLANQPYLFAEKEMEQVLLSQQQVLDTLSFYLNEKSESNWPVELIQRSILTDEKLLTGLGAAKPPIEYPASDMLNSFRAGLQRIQALKKRAVDDYTFAARKSARHSNEFYKSFINAYNSDLLSWHQNFVRNSATVKQLLDYPKFSPVFAVDVPAVTAPEMDRRQSPDDAQAIAFTTKPATTTVSAATFQALNAYVDFINESLRQMNRMQLLIREYQSSAEFYRDPSRSGRRSSLTYAHEDFKVPVSEHQTLVINSPNIPPAYRPSINGQADVLLAMLKEMDALSIELINYTSGKTYEQDRLQRSDAILDRYAQLFDRFDQRKEQLYRDVRRIYESYPVRKPSDSWNVAGKALLRIIDTDKAILFGVKAYLKGETTQLPATDSLQTEARTLIVDEFKNLKGLQRYGRNNGSCPYSPYEDLAESSLKLAEMTQHLSTRSNQNPYESFYYFFNNALVYEYNKFSELAKPNLLKTVNQPNVFAFRRSNPSASPLPPTTPADRPRTDLVAERKPVSKQKIADSPPVSPSVAPEVNGKTIIQHDTVYINHSAVDTVYIDRSGPQEIPTSLKGFAANNMVLLLDVSASMESPYKMPLLKKSIKSLLKLLRPEDQISVVVYSGKARIALKPTSGTNTDEITRVIDQLQSDGETDGNGGIRLAYKLADKNYLRAGNNRIVLATDGEFAVSDEIFELVGESSRQDVYLTVFTFGRNEVKSNVLKKLAQSGKGTYAHVTPGNADLKLILEAQAKKVP